MALARRRIQTDQSAREPADNWLSTHTLQDIRDLAQELSDRGEDVTELVGAVNELEELLAVAARPEPSEATTA